MNKRKSNRNWVTLFFVLYFATFLPNFGIFNSLTWIGPLPLSLFFVLFLNALNTIIIFVIYFKFFKPFALRVEKEIELEDENEMKLETKKVN